jgi:hypothetical protein
MGFFAGLFDALKKPSRSRPDVAPRLSPRKSRPPRIVWRADSFPTEVVGESNYQSALTSICGPHSRHGHDLEVVASLSREPENAHDPKAVMVSVRGLKVGYLPRDQAERVSAQMHSEGIATAECNARIQGGWRTNQHDEGHFGIRLAMPMRGWIDFGIGAEPPGGHPKPSTRPLPARRGPMSREWVVVLGQASDGPIAHMLAGKGAHVMAGIGKSTSIMVVNGERPFDEGLRNSATYKKAEAAGPRLRIMTMDEVRQEFR